MRTHRIKLKTTIMNECNPDYIKFSDDRVEQVGGLYEALKHQMNDVLADLVPAPWCKQRINPRVELIFKMIAQLRDHCCDKEENLQESDTTGADHGPAAGSS